MKVRHVLRLCKLTIIFFSLFMTYHDKILYWPTRLISTKWCGINVLMSPSHRSYKCKFWDLLKVRHLPDLHQKNQWSYTSGSHYILDTTLTSTALAWWGVKTCNSPGLIVALWSLWSNVFLYSGLAGQQSHPWETIIISLG